MRPFSSRLAVRVVLVVVMVIVPALGIIIYDQINDRRRAREEAVESANRLAHLAANEQSRVLEGVQRLLGTLALFPALRDGDLAGCQHLLPDVLRRHRDYINIFVDNGDGAMLCAAMELPPTREVYNAKKTSWFERVMQTHAPAAGDFQISRLTGRPAIILAAPITAASGRIERVVAAVIALDQLNATFDTVKLPRGATLTLTDQRGTILVRTPSSPAMIGARHAQFPIASVASSLHERGSMIESTGSDGIRRLYTVVPLDAGLGTGLYVTLDVE